jgi:hypothetical protein
MGLDMYLTGEKYFVRDYQSAEYLDNDASRPIDDDGERIESSNHSLAYWRKFAPLHNFIVDEFANGEDDCQRIGLGRDDLIKIAEAIEGNKLPPDDDCLGFFFGSPEIWAEYRAEAKEHAAQFRAAATWFDAAPKYESGSPMQWRSVHYQAIW